MQSIRSDFELILSKIDRPGNFHVSGDFAIHPPSLSVEGVGPQASYERRVVQRREDEAHRAQLLAGDPVAA